MRDSKTESKQTKGGIEMETEGKDTDFYLKCFHYHYYYLFLSSNHLLKKYIYMLICMYI
jgi:hypothetical protein